MAVLDSVLLLYMTVLYIIMTLAVHIVAKVKGLPDGTSATTVSQDFYRKKTSIL